MTTGTEVLGVVAALIVIVGAMGGLAVVISMSSWDLL